MEGFWLMLHLGIPMERLAHLLNNVNLTKLLCLKSSEDIERMTTYLNRFGGGELILRRPTILNFDLDSQLALCGHLMLEISKTLGMHMILWNNSVRRRNPEQTTYIEDDPRTFDKAMKSRDVAFWKEGINDEMDLIMENNIWILFNLPPGFRQKEGIDYFDTYALVARISIIRLWIALAATYNLVIHQIDVKTAFLNGDLEEEDIGEADVILGIRIKHKGKGITINQSHNIEKILKKFKCNDCCPVSTPLDSTIKLMPNIHRAVDQLEYSRSIDFLMYEMTSTRPNIAYVVGKLSRYNSNPSTHHWHAIMRVFKYLKKTMDYGLSYVGFPSVLKGYSDESWITNSEDHTSTTSWVFCLVEVPFHGLLRSKLVLLTQQWKQSAEFNVESSFLVIEAHSTQSSQGARIKGLPILKVLVMRMDRVIVSLKMIDGEDKTEFIDHIQPHVNVIEDDLEVLDFDSLESDQEDVPENARSRGLRKLRKKHMSPGISNNFYVGKEFLNRDLAKARIRAYTVETRRNLDFKRNDKRRIQVICNGIFLLFQGWMLLGKPPGCLCTPTSVFVSKDGSSMTLISKESFVQE
ncbi:zinc finger, CCHC-type containing protein [Tanacetum coccineum]